MRGFFPDRIFLRQSAARRRADSARENPFCMRAVRLRWRRRFVPATGNERIVASRVYAPPIEISRICRKIATVGAEPPATRIQTGSPNRSQSSATICRIWTICFVEDKMNDARHSHGSCRSRRSPRHAATARASARRREKFSARRPDRFPFGEIRAASSKSSPAWRFRRECRPRVCVRRTECFPTTPTQNRFASASGKPGRNPASPPDRNRGRAEEYSRRGHYSTDLEFPKFKFGTSDGSFACQRGNHFFPRNCHADSMATAAATA